MSQAPEIEVTAKDLPLHCPAKEVALWCSHPRVFLDIADSGTAMCPYCGTKYRMKDGEVVGKHH
jgi:uncharacterized Zn-finger protein